MPTLQLETRRHVPLYWTMTAATTAALVSDGRVTLAAAVTVGAVTVGVATRPLRTRLYKMMTRQSEIAIREEEAVADAAERSHRGERVRAHERVDTRR